MTRLLPSIVLLWRCTKVPPKAASLRLNLEMSSAALSRMARLQHKLAALHHAFVVLHQSTTEASELVAEAGELGDTFCHLLGIFAPFSEQKCPFVEARFFMQSLPF